MQSHYEGTSLSRQAQIRRLDGTLARLRQEPRPRYGFYVDHCVDALGATALLSGLALSGLAQPAVAAALLAKGLSPGAALVFLLTGPATNAGTLTVVGRVFGRRFLLIYLGSIVGVAVAESLRRLL